MGSPPAENAGTVFVELLKGELEEEKKTKASFEQRGVMVVTTSATLVTLLFAFAALTKGTGKFTLPAGGKWTLGLALLFLLLAAILGIATNWPTKYKGLNLGDLKNNVAERWGHSHAKALKGAAKAQVEIVLRARKKNNVKSWLLTSAMASEVFGVAFVAASILVILGWPESPLGWPEWLLGPPAGPTW